MVDFLLPGSESLCGSGSAWRLMRIGTGTVRAAEMLLFPFLPVILTNFLPTDTLQVTLHNLLQNAVI